MSLNWASMFFVEIDVIQVFNLNYIVWQKYSIMKMQVVKSIAIV